MANQIRDLPSQGKLYIITRDDLPNSFQAVQSIHAVTDLIFKYSPKLQEWYKESNTVVLLSVSNKKALDNVQEGVLPLNFLDITVAF